MRTGDAVDEERGRGGGLQGEEEVMALAGPCRALLQFFRAEGGVDGIREAGAVGLGQAYQLRGGHFVGGECCEAEERREGEQQKDPCTHSRRTISQG